MPRRTSRATGRRSVIRRPASHPVPGSEQGDAEGALELVDLGGQRGPADVYTGGWPAGKFSSSASATKARECSTRIAPPPSIWTAARDAGRPTSEISPPRPGPPRRAAGAVPATSQVIAAGRGAARCAP